MSGGKVAVSSVSFTLPLSCQICLGKVREPVTCSNQHVFCSDCMNVWLERNSCCPTCRVQISPQSPVKRIIGGVIENSSSSLVSRGTSRELRRTRYELILKEYENDIQQLEIGMERLERENKSLKSELRMLKQVKVETVNEYFNTNTSCQRCTNIKDVDTMLDMTKKLQEATKTYSKTKKEMNEVKKINEILRKNNDDLKRENQRVKEEVSTRSPMKFGRLTVAALESRLESSEKQVAQLMKALQKNDEHTDQLEAELAELKQPPMKENYNGDKLQNPILASILNEPQTNCENLPERGTTVATPSSKLKNLTLVTPEHKNYSEPSFCSRDDQATARQDGVETMLSFPSDLKSTISRKLTFETKEVTEENKAPQTECKNADLLTIQDAYDLALDLSHSWSDEPAENSPLESIPDHGVLMTNPPLRLHESFNCASQSSIDDEIFHNWETPNVASMKTTIDAGGSRITMSQLSESEKDAFSRPSSAPSRTFLLSGSKFSALRSLDPTSQQNLSSFQPVKCISPLNGYTKIAPEKGSPLQLVSPDEVTSSSCNEDKDSLNRVEEPNRRELLSRVNILKRNSSFSKQTIGVGTSGQTAVGENRRKQKLSQKRTGELLLQNVLKSPKF